MEGHRYADDEPSWYPGQGQYARSTDPGTTGSHARPSGAFRLPEQRPAVAPPANPYALADPLTTTGSHARSPRGPEYPTIRPVDEPVQPEPRAKEVVYRSRRPISVFVLGFVTIVLAVPVIRLLIDEGFRGNPAPAGIVPAVLLTLGFTLTAVGLFGLAKGGTIEREAWWRPPTAYLPMGLILLVAAGLAVA
ncbi:hypothetical protein GCM10010172_35530 [Paractinoplanes ferrugineus]|uniref:Uncharacterized protein n=1 Tax=Paractinoplanes ferrugineus TaxID=113564 RepID=A0A919IVV9_9ACTN|nr:hypothetical protein [Actinoplanes ferrugineus]GIE09149.1 hypothetical protein Afe05nite_09890 [Actinoplanes ferrugineus]